MKIYLASKFALKDRIIYLSDWLTKNGFKITCKWWYDDIKKIPVTDDEWYKHPEVIKIADRDYLGIDEAKVLILVSNIDVPLSFNGANVELGYALAKGKKVIILGKVDRNALYSKAIFCKNEDQLLIELQIIQQEL